MRAWVDPALCFSFALCVEEAPEVFELGADEVSRAGPVGTGQRENVLAAARSCPVAAIRVWDDEGLPLLADGDKSSGAGRTAGRSDGTGGRT